MECRVDKEILERGNDMVSEYPELFGALELQNVEGIAIFFVITRCLLRNILFLRV